jgi:pyrroline-5-carboxylate reductase
MTQAIVSTLLRSGQREPNEISASNRTEKKLQSFAGETGIHAVANNETLIENSDIVFLAVKPQDLYATLEPIASTFDDHHIVVSLIAGVSLHDLQNLLPNTKNHLRVIANAASRIGESVVGVALSDGVEPLWSSVEEILSPIGKVVLVDDGDQIEALLVATSSGVGFVFELMNYWQEWLEERGFSPREAQDLTTHTFLGASRLAQNQPEHSYEELIRKVASAKGVTAAGLASIRELEIERALRISFEKASLRDKELGASAKSID